MTLSTLLWAVPVFFVTGVIIGIILQLALPSYERGCTQIVWLAAITLLAVVLVTLLMAVVRSFDPSPTADVRLRRIPLAVLYTPFLLGALIGRFVKRKSRVQRRRRVVAPAGSHHVPTDLGTSTGSAAPAPVADTPDGSLPTPFGPGAHDVRHPTESNAPLLPPQPPPPPPPPASPRHDPPAAPGF